MFSHDLGAANILLSTRKEPLALLGSPESLVHMMGWMFELNQHEIDFRRGGSYRLNSNRSRASFA